MRGLTLRVLGRSLIARMSRAVEAVGQPTLGSAVEELARVDLQARLVAPQLEPRGGPGEARAESQERLKSTVLASIAPR